VKGASASPTLPAQRSGFSLILSLVVMAFMLLMMFSLASFITIESRVATHQQNQLRARLNAVVSLRLALGHLQQEAGPDRRITARADIIANTTQPGWTWLTLRNPLWTGVWRSDLQLQPPAWLISGRHDETPGSQSVNLQGQSDFYLSQWVPWQSDYVYPDTQGITLVGDTSASAAELPSGNYAGKPDGRIVLPRINLPDTDVFGSYCYWIGDEGVKARLNLGDPRLTPTDGTASTPQLKQEALRGTSRSGNEILPGLATMPLSGIDPRVSHVQQLSLLTNGGGVVETNPPTIVRGLTTETTLWSRGVNADSLWGGLKVDLSLAFEMNDADWANSEFGAGTTPTDSAGNPLSGVTYVYHPNGVSQRRAFGVTKTNLSFDGTTRGHAPLYVFDQNLLTIRGPLWDTLRNYHRLYKEVTWVTPTAPEINARTHYPSNVALSNAGYGTRSHYGRFYNRSDTSGDFLNTTTLHGLPAPRPTKVAVSPYVSREILAFGLQNHGGLARLTVTPIVVLHNPYGINLRLGRKNTPLEPAGMRFSFRKWETLSLSIQTGSSTPWTRTLGQLAATADPTSTSDENFRTYLSAEVLLAPGEFRIFSLPGVGTTPPVDIRPAQFNRIGGIMLQGLETRGGVWLTLPTSAGTPLSATASTTTVRLMNSGVFETRVMLPSWPGDNIEADSLDGASELNTLLTTNLSRSAPSSPAFTFGGTSGVSLPGIGAEPRILGVIDQGLRWPLDPGPWPLFSHSNPMAAVTRADASGRATTSTPVGRAFTSPSYRTTMSRPSAWGNVIETTGIVGTETFGGLSQTSSLSGGLAGVSSAVYTEVPLAPPLSLAQYTHANFGLRDQDALFQIGQSFAPLNCYNNSAATTDSGAGVTNHEGSWMANVALFDRFFLSGAAPVIRRGADVTEVKSLETVLDDFAAGQGKLANPRTWLFAQRDEETVRRMLRDHRRIAGTILSEGTFNVNSTSVPAWAALLASAKRNALGAANELEPSPTNNARFPRAVRADGAAVSHGNNFVEPNAWTGLATLSDDQIWTLARFIVEEMRNRMRFNHRYEYGLRATPYLDIHYVIRNRGAEVPLPFIGLSQFLNRFNCAPYANDIAWQGCLQNAILRADVAGANLSNRSTPLIPAPAFGTAQTAANSTLAGGVPYVFVPGNAVATHPRINPTTQNRNHALRAAPTSLTQADILAAVGSSLATRSDTFVIRCFGDAADPLDPSKTHASCWIEAVVQRIPEFCDPSQPPETEVSSPTDGQKHNPLLNPVNQTLGRRFIILSSRMLGPNDL
jgi:hypothetical protein